MVALKNMRLAIVKTGIKSQIKINLSVSLFNILQTNEIVDKLLGWRSFLQASTAVYKIHKIEINCVACVAVKWRTRHFFISHFKF